ncbi:hypothetical protein [Streptomyces celluloflavus]|uniref:hypothetical protein n=1 Tax=Streptomyces celluloflavus TaxID=58344 RepID=UPI0036B24838
MGNTVKIRLFHDGVTIGYAMRPSSGSALIVGPEPEEYVKYVNDDGTYYRIYGTEEYLAQSGADHEYTIGRATFDGATTFEIKDDGSFTSGETGKRITYKKEDSRLYASGEFLEVTAKLRT